MPTSCWFYCSLYNALIVQEAKGTDDHSKSTIKSILKCVIDLYAHLFDCLRIGTLERNKRKEWLFCFFVVCYFPGGEGIELT